MTALLILTFVCLLVCMPRMREIPFMLTDSSAASAAEAATGATPLDVSGAGLWSVNGEVARPNESGTIRRIVAVLNPDSADVAGADEGVIAENWLDTIMNTMIIVKVSDSVVAVCNLFTALGGFRLGSAVTAAGNGSSPVSEPGVAVSEPMPADKDIRVLIQPIGAHGSNTQLNKLLVLIRYEED